MSIIKFIEKVKYFGIRFLYYRVIEKKYPNIGLRFVDLIKPRISSSYLSKILIDKYWGFIGHGVEEFPVFLGLGIVHYSLIRISKPRRVLCIGSYRGFVPVICAIACQENKKGVVDFVDAGIDMSANNELLGDGFWKKADINKHFGSDASSKYLKVYVMKTSEYAAKFKRKRYEYIYVDGNHTYSGVKNDYKMFWPRLEKEGYMVFHDILGEGMGGVKFGVKKLWKEIPEKRKVQISFPKETGLGILQK